jgi:hypothetical protein
MAVTVMLPTLATLGKLEEIASRQGALQDF